MPYETNPLFENMNQDARHHGTFDDNQTFTDTKCSAATRMRMALLSNQQIAGGKTYESVL